MPKTATLLLVVFLIISLAGAQSQAQDGPQASAERVGTQRQLFVDPFIVERMNQARLVLHEPRDEGPVLHFDRPWEGPFSGYSTVIHDGGRFRLYYRGIPASGHDGTDSEVTCYAESVDGIRWSKPDLGIHEVAGTTKNNVILADAAPVTHNFCPFLDTRPGIPEEERYKALGGNEKSGLIAYQSGDGIHWSRMQDSAVITQGMFDSQNVAFWSEAEMQYVAYFRIWTGDGYTGYRSVGRATSDDFIHWSQTEAMTFGDTPMQHLYTNQTHPYFRAPQIYVAIAARFMPGRQVINEEAARRLGVDPGYFKDCSDAVLMTSRGGTQYDRTFMEGFIRPGIGLSNWVSRTNYPALNVVQTGPTEMSIFVNQDYAQPTAHLRRYSLRLDGFVSVYAPFSGGELVTKPFIFSGNLLLLNFATSAAGSVRLEIQDQSGKPYEGFELERSPLIIGNEIDKEIRWPDGPGLSHLSGKPVRLRFVLMDAHVYSFKFAACEDHPVSLFQGTY